MAATTLVQSTQFAPLLTSFPANPFCFVFLSIIKISVQQLINLFLRFCYRHVRVLLFSWAIIILGLCGMPGRFVPSTSWFELLSFDKWVHASIFFILCGLGFLTQIKYNYPTYLVFIITALAILYGGVIEWMQANWFSERSADWYDFYANTFGCLTALSLYKVLYRRITCLKVV